MNRRELISLLGGVATWPLAARAQQPNRVRRVAVLVGGLAADDPEWQSRGTAFVQGLQELGWSEGRNVRIEYRWGLNDQERARKAAAELAAFNPDVLLAAGTSAIEPLRAAMPNLPLIFANVLDPVANGFVQSLARPGGNITGFMNIEFGVSAKSLELLKQLAPQVRRVAVLRVSTVSIGPMGAIQAVAPSLGVELTPVFAREVGEIERAIINFARGSSDGLILLGGGITQVQRAPIIRLAASHRLPAVYSFRRFAVEGGLISFGSDQAEPYRLAAGYVDRVLKGEKPGELPVQAPTRLETVLNLKTAKALGLDVPSTVLARADEVIE
jgi:putative ABC transport system substrate-binding protein